ncbi:hypothetical protein RCL1_005666 [Eukaryota sp. TZLM3-RCL]
MSYEVLWNLVNSASKALRLEASDFPDHRENQLKIASVLDEVLVLKDSLSPSLIESQERLTSQVKQMSTLMTSKLSEYNTFSAEITAALQQKEEEISGLQNTVQSLNNTLSIKSQEMSHLRSLLRQYEHETGSLREQIALNNETIEKQHETISNLMLQVEVLDKSCVDYESQLKSSKIGRKKTKPKS